MLELAQNIPCKFGPVSRGKEYDLKHIDDYAKKYAMQLMKNSDQDKVHRIFLKADQ